MERYIQDSFTAGIICPSSSPVGAGFFFVGKKDGTLRHCIDFRGMNNITVKTNIPYLSKGFFLCLSQGESTEFGQIELMLVKEEKHVHFIVTPHDVSYLPEFGLYEVKEARQSMKCRKAELKLYYPLPAYKLFGTRVISLKHSTQSKDNEKK